MDSEKICNILTILGNGYCTGNFNEIFEYLDDNCVWESQWVIEAKSGIDAVKEYYITKGKLLKEHNSKCSFKIVETNTLRNSLGLVVVQEVDGKKNEVYLEVKISEKYKILRIDVCNPAFFNYREYNSTNL